MPFSTNPNVSVPVGLVTDTFILQPLRESDVERDFAAVMETRDLLRQWSQSDWPADDFTLDGNREDLIRHEREHLDNDAYTYTVLDTDANECIGCVYIHTTAARSYAEAQITPLDDARPWSDYAATIYFWARASRLADGLDRQLLIALHAWFNDAWQLPQHLFVTSEQFTQQLALLDSEGLQPRFRIHRKNYPGDYLAYSYPDA